MDGLQFNETALKLMTIIEEQCVAIKAPGGKIEGPNTSTKCLLYILNCHLVDARTQFASNAHKALTLKLVESLISLMCLKLKYCSYIVSHVVYSV